MGVLLAYIGRALSFYGVESRRNCLQIS